MRSEAQQRLQRIAERRAVHPDVELPVKTFHKCGAWHKIVRAVQVLARCNTARACDGAQHVVELATAAQRPVRRATCLPTAGSESDASGTLRRRSAPCCSMRQTASTAATATNCRRSTSVWPGRLMDCVSPGCFRSTEPCESHDTCCGSLDHPGLRAGNAIWRGFWRGFTRRLRGNQAGWQHHE